jgi:hypothetical protein
MAAYVELYIDKGTSFQNKITLTDDSTNTSINLAGYSARSQLRRSYYSTNASANVICTISDPANGEITMTLSASNTSNLKAGAYLFDLQTTDPVGAVTRVLEGTITVLPEVTR